MAILRTNPAARIRNVCILFRYVFRLREHSDRVHIRHFADLHILVIYIPNYNPKLHRGELVLAVCCDFLAVFVSLCCFCETASLAISLFSTLSRRIDHATQVSVCALPRPRHELRAREPLQKQVGAASSYCRAWTLFQTHRLRISGCPRRACSVLEGRCGGAVGLLVLALAVAVAARMGAGSLSRLVGERTEPGMCSSPVAEAPPEAITACYDVRIV